QAATRRSGTGTSARLGRSGISRPRDDVERKDVDATHTQDRTRRDGPRHRTRVYACMSVSPLRSAGGVSASCENRSITHRAIAHWLGIQFAHETLGGALARVPLLLGMADALAHPAAGNVLEPADLFLLASFGSPGRRVRSNFVRLLGYHRPQRQQAGHD